MFQDYVLLAIAISFAVLAIQYIVAQYQNKDNNDDDPTLDEFAATSEHPSSLKAHNDI